MIGTSPAPDTYEPPWIHTITGSASSGRTSRGIVTETRRQSSSTARPAKLPSTASSSSMGGCGHAGAHEVAARGSVQSGCGTGGAKRAAVAYGIPVARTTSPSVQPTTGPQGGEKALIRSTLPFGRRSPGGPRARRIPVLP